MAYNPTDWKDQIITEPTKYKIRRQDGSEEVVNIESAPGDVIQEGTKITAERLNNIERGISDNVSEINKVRTQMSLQQALEILDLKMQLEKQNLINFINKTGVGFYDLFDTTDNIDLNNTDAIVNTTNKKVEFQSKENFTVKSVGAFTNTTDIKVDGKVAVGYKINDILVNSVTSQKETKTNTVTDATVINSAFTTSKNARPQVLSNGWIVTSTWDSTNHRFDFQVDKIDGNGFVPLCYASNSPYFNGKWSIISKDNDIYMLVENNNVAVMILRFDATVVISSYDIMDSYLGGSWMNVDISQTAINDCSLAISPDKTTLHACWSSKNSTYSNSFNIRYRKGTINEDGSITWDSVEQWTNENYSTSDNIIQPTILIDNDGYPAIIAMVENGNGTTYTGYYSKNAKVGNNDTNTLNPVDTSIYTKIISFEYGYSAGSPSAIFVPKSINGLSSGRIWVAWHGYDSEITGRWNIRVAYSDDGGVTWSTMKRITSNSITAQYNVSVTCNKNNEVFLYFEGPILVLIIINNLEL